MTQAKVNQLRLLQQNLQSVSTQKQQIQNQAIEIDSALETLEGAQSSFRIVGKIMIAAAPQKLKQELQERKNAVDVRLKAFTKQEEKLKESIEGMQKEVLEELQQKK
ncbi:TPA: prefoldin subunit beta [Candidatus Woesearchaeota archaeon]|nr:prefoldin subunit beta [Candidatus Woesearchaeota archaeon]